MKIVKLIFGLIGLFIFGFALVFNFDKQSEWPFLMFCYILGFVLMMPFYRTTNIYKKSNEKIEKVKAEEQTRFNSLMESKASSLKTHNIDFALTYITTFGNKAEFKEINYITGHPEIINPRVVNVGFNNDNMILFEMKSETPNKICDIPLKDIENITSEDKSSVERKVSTLDVLAYGSLGKAMAKDVKVVEHYVVINWKQGKFTHDTIFSFKSKNAVSEANAFRSELINRANNS